MSDAHAYAEQIARRLHRFQTDVLVSQDGETWHARARLAVDWLTELDAIAREARELRRAYSAELDASLLNRFDLRLDDTRAQLVALLRVTIDATAKEAQR